MYVYTYIYMHLSLFSSIDLSLFIPVYLSLYIRSVDMHVYMDVCMYVCVCRYVYVSQSIHIHLCQCVLIKQLPKMSPKMFSLIFMFTLAIEKKIDRFNAHYVTKRQRDVFHLLNTLLQFLLLITP